MQSASSVEDQIRLCAERVEREGMAVTQHYADHGISGASLMRPGIQQLLQDAMAGKFQVVFAEALDRISRDQEDIAAVFKRLSFAGVQIITLSEGAVSELHIGLKGTMNALFLKDLSDKTRRGLRGRVEAGKSGGGNSYGYDVVRKVNAAGEPERGDRKINEDQADIVRRIFNEYAAGTSPRVIAKTLNAEHVPGPTGKTWGPSTIHGNKDRGTGILNNELYIGRLVWNRLRYVKDPETGKRLSRLNPPDQWIVQDVPHLRIIDDDLWQKVKARQDATALGKQDKSKAEGFWDRRRPRFLLSGLIKCGCCGSTFVKISQQHFGCASARNKGTCESKRTIRRDVLEASVLNGLQHRLMDDKLLAVFCEEYTRHMNALRMAESGNRAKDEARLQKVIRELDRMIDAICDGVPAERVKDRMIALEAERAEIEKRLEAEPKEEKPLLHPSMGERYRQGVMRLRESLADKNAQHEAVEILRGLIDRIVLHPSSDEASGFVMDIEGDLAGILSLCQTSKKAAGLSPDDLMQIKLVAGARSGHDLPAEDDSGGQMKLVAGVGFEPTTFRL
ncbi:MULTISPECIES: recombinase family protein [unclassified Sulfitobacter]|uniref:recombinase family protein n=1 Tax=unclassified Sulfitobacter TaxID=196795 RepID=UPI002E810F73|nr:MULTISPECIES: recombinase family protein [unclassified Sulfitobacter]